MSRRRSSGGIRVIIREYYKPDAPDPILPEDLVLELARRHRPGLHAVTGIDESGGEARVYFLDRDYVFKVQRPQQLRSWTSLAKEVRFLERLAADAPGLPVPRVEGHARNGSVEYTLMTRIGGDAAVRTAIPDAMRPETLRALGRVIRAIHEIAQEPLRSSGLFPEEYTADDLRAGIQDDIREYEERFQRRGLGWPLGLSPLELSERLKGAVPESPPAIALHTNPGPTHTFVDPVTGRFLGLIDFGDAYIGHPAHDLGRWPDPADRAFVLEGYREAGQLGPGFEGFLPVVAVLADLLVMLRNPERTSMARDDLETILQGIRG